MALTRSEEAAIVSIVSRELRPELRRLFDRVDDLLGYAEGITARLDRADIDDGSWRDEMRSQTQSLLTAVAVLGTVFTSFSAAVDERLTAIQTAHDDGDDDGVTKAIADLGTLKDSMASKLDALKPKADAVAALAPTMPESPSAAGNTSATANPPSADPAAAPFDPAAVPGESLGSQAVASGSTDGKPVEGQTVQDGPGAAAIPVGSPVTLPADAATGTETSKAVDPAAPSSES